MLKTLSLSILLNLSNATKTYDVTKEKLFKVSRTGMLYSNPSIPCHLNDSQFEKMIKKLQPEDTRGAKEVSIDGHDITRIPSKLVKKIPTIRKLYLKRCSCLTTIDCSELKKLRELEELWIEEANIESISRDAFEGLGIKELYITRNQTNLSIGSNAFVGLSNLKVLCLSLNKIEEIRDNTFRGLSNLTVLNLSQNKIKKISSDTFRGLYKLTTLYLNDNPIEAIDSDAFDELPNFKELYISKNKPDEAIIKKLKVKMPNLRMIPVDYSQ